MDLERIRDAIRRAAPAADHPINDVLLEDAIEDASAGGLAGTGTLLRRRGVLRISALDLRKARESAENAGRLGEELVNAFLLARLNKGDIEGFSWASEENVVSPYDFTVSYASGEVAKLDVKATSGPFERTIHISMNELLEMATAVERYDLYRVYLADRQRACLRIAEDTREFAKAIVSKICLPPGVTIDSVSVDPRTLPFGDEIIIEPLYEEDPAMLPPPAL